MFRVTIEEYNNLGPVRFLDIIMKTEKLYELIGRLTLKINDPVTLVNEEGIRELEFFKHIGQGSIATSVCFANISNDSK